MKPVEIPGDAAGKDPLGIHALHDGRQSTAETRREADRQPAQDLVQGLLEEIARPRPQAAQGRRRPDGRCPGLVEGDRRDAATAANRTHKERGTRCIGNLSPGRNVSRQTGWMSTPS